MRGLWRESEEAKAPESLQDVQSHEGLDFKFLVFIFLKLNLFDDSLAKSLRFCCLSTSSRASIVEKCLGKIVYKDITSALPKL